MLNFMTKGLRVPDYKIFDYYKINAQKFPILQSQGKTLSKLIF